MPRFAKSYYLYEEFRQKSVIFDLDRMLGEYDVTVHLAKFSFASYEDDGFELSSPLSVLFGD